MTIAELEDFFNTATLPETIILNDAERITDVRKFVDSHLITLKKHGLTNTYAAFYERLMNVKLQIKAAG